MSSAEIITGQLSNNAWCPKKTIQFENGKHSYERPTSDFAERADYLMIDNVKLGYDHGMTRNH